MAVSHCTNCFKYQLLLLNEIFQFKCMSTLYCYLFGNRAMLLSEPFAFLRTECHLRFCNQLAVHYCRTSLCKKSFLLTAISMWNNLSDDLHSRPIRKFVLLKKCYNK
jgi:hypothetical protein